MTVWVAGLENRFWCWVSHRADDIAADAIGSYIHRNRASHVGETSFGGVIDSEIFVRASATNRTKVDD